MKLPNASLAIVDRDKITDYLLNAAHPDNGGKAQFFAVGGFSPGRWQDLARALQDLANSVEVSECIQSQHGVKYALDGPIIAPSGAKAWVRTIWIVDKGSDFPRLVTAYPLKK